MRTALPPRASQILDVFLHSGADINQANDRGWTPLHQAAYSNQVELAKRLVEAGAAPDREAHGEGGTPLAVALFWGHREVADVLARAVIVPRNLRIAAGLGRVDLVDECFEPDGYDVKVLDRLVTRVAREIRLLEQALKTTNARTTIEAYDQDDAALGELS
jgi:ankyrin repeat protein